LKKELKTRIGKLPKELQKILKDDMETALEKRLEVLENVR
jgi:hypothetical protein